MSSFGFSSARAAQPRSCATTTKVGSVDILLETSYDKLGTGAASATSDEVEHKITITNNGLLRLYDIGVEDGGLQARGVRISCTDVGLQTATGADPGVFAGLAAYPGNGLAPAASLTCTARDGVTQAEVGQSAVRVASTVCIYGSALRLLRARCVDTKPPCSPHIRNCRLCHTILPSMLIVRL